MPMTNSPEHMLKLRVSAPLRFRASIGSAEIRYMSSRQTPAGTVVAGAAVANVTVTSRLTDSLELVGTVRNLFNRSYADPASDEHVHASLEQNGRTARVGIRWNLWRQ
jgi:iron complex outermembrane receptor protein